MGPTLAACALIGAASWPVPDDRPLTYADAVVTALADARKLPYDVQPHVRYLTAFHLRPVEREITYRVVSLHVNSVSRTPYIVRPVQVASWLWRIDLRDYGVDAGTYANAGNASTGQALGVDPYYHEYVRVRGVNDPQHARWLPSVEIAELQRLTGSYFPIFRADWWFHRTAQQEGRAGFGYYDLAGLKSETDIHREAGFDPKLAPNRNERAVIVTGSGVAVSQKRQMFRFGAELGVVWETRDVNVDAGSTAERNARTQRFEGYKFDAKEVVWSRPNRLPGFALVDADGKLQASAPNNVAGNHRSPALDFRVHAGSWNCYGCHNRAGLIPFTDYLRDNQRSPRIEKDYGAYKRERAAYYEPVQSDLDRDSDRFREQIERACGLTPEGVTEHVVRVWRAYDSEPITVEIAAAEVGVSVEEFRSRVAEYLKHYDPEHDRRVADLLSDLVDPRPAPLDRQSWEEAFPLAQLACGYPGVKPVPLGGLP